MQPHLILEPHERLPKHTHRSGLVVCETDVGQVKGRDRNKPCPCGSGRKHKKCHGRAS